jgi:hypothetical protein
MARGRAAGGLAALCSWMVGTGPTMTFWKN